MLEPTPADIELPALPPAPIESYQVDGTMRSTKLLTYGVFDMTFYARAAILADRATRADGWLPIETAPKDGSAILLGHSDDGDDGGIGGFVGQGRWHEEDEDGPDNMGHDAGFMDDRFDFFRCGRSFGNPAYQHQGLQPTHWRKLPPPPLPSDKEAA